MVAAGYFGRSKRLRVRESCMSKLLVVKDVVRTQVDCCLVVQTVALEERRSAGQD